MRLVLSGTMERHPDLKIVMSHTGGALPYQSGRMDKNSKAAKLPRPVSEYLKRMYTDTVSPHTAGMQFAIDYYGLDHVMYGTDYPCWDPAPCLKLLEDVRLTQADKQKLFLRQRAADSWAEGPCPGQIVEARAGAGLTPACRMRGCDMAGLVPAMLHFGLPNDRRSIRCHCRRRPDRACIGPAPGHVRRQVDGVQH